MQGLRILLDREEIAFIQTEEGRMPIRYRTYSLILVLYASKSWESLRIRYVGAITNAVPRIPSHNPERKADALNNFTMGTLLAGSGCNQSCVTLLSNALKGVELSRLCKICPEDIENPCSR